MKIKYIKKIIKSFFCFFARKDPLTGLPNRSEIKRKRKRKGVIVYFDLDNFKIINDRLCHAIGDFVLREFANLLLREVRNKDSVIRWGGDEFLVILHGANEEEADYFIRRIRIKTKNIDVTRRSDYKKLKAKVDNLESEEKIKKTIKKMGVSAGVAEIKKNIICAIHNADIRMYKDKRENKEKLPKTEVIDAIKDEELIDILGMSKKEALEVIEKMKEKGFIIGKRI